MVVEVIVQSGDKDVNVRVILQLVAGNGPTYNLNERVEVGTSTLWLVFVTLGKLIWEPAYTRNTAPSMFAKADRSGETDWRARA